MKKNFLIIIILSINLTSFGQELKFKKVALTDEEAVSLEMQKLAIAYLQQSKIQANDRYMIEILAGEYKASINTIESLREGLLLNHGHLGYVQFELYSKAKILQEESSLSFNESYQSVFKSYISNCNDEQAYSANIVFTTYDAVAQFSSSFESKYNNITNDSLGKNQALDLLKSYFLFRVYSLTEAIVNVEIELDENKRYIIEEQLIISPNDGAELSVITARKRVDKSLPAVLIFTIYADESNIKSAILAASKGYVGVVATSRGKRLSKDQIEPFKNEHKDVYSVIDWISVQSWNNSKVGMFGGSYDAFVQWASMKERVHPALKTIIPCVAIAPGIDYPMENNIFFNFPYKWIPYVTNNKYLDKAVNFDRKRWKDLESRWFVSGKAYNKLDSIDGNSNPIFQEWISHPNYDDYWKSMVAYKDEFAHINIPILSITGYYDDSQRGALYYHSEHLKHNTDAEHYLLIGPYDHWGAQFTSSANLRGYNIDEVAHINIKEELAFDWFDYVLKGKEKPSILKDKVNFQVMGTNTWMHKSSIAEMANDSLCFYLSSKTKDDHYLLAKEKSSKSYMLDLKIDLEDRTKMNNTDYYPWPIIKDSLNLKDGLSFISDPLKKETIINGPFKGELFVECNKKDFDFGVNIYELTTEGKYFHLSFYIARASYSDSNEHRKLLIPNKETRIKFENTRMVSKKISKNSRIVIVVNGNKNSNAQINYGSGKDVSTESIIDARTPLKLRISSKSKITFPIWLDN